MQVLKLLLLNLQGFKKFINASKSYMRKPKIFKQITFYVIFILNIS